MLKVSIIVPVYNVERFLERCLDSLVNQTLEDIEIICINDGSTDGSGNILSKYAEKDNRIIVINQKNSGLSEARNNGIERANGEYLGFVDSDDYIDIDYYEKLYNTAKLNNADIACTGIIRGNDKKQKVLISYNEIEEATDINEKFQLVKAPEYSFVWNKIYLKESLCNQKIDFIKGLIYEDMPFTTDVLIKLGKVVSVPNTYYHYWKNNNSIIKFCSDKSRTDKIFAKDYVIQQCKINNIKLSEKNSITKKIEYFFLGIKIMKIYQYRATKKYYLFGLFPILICRESV
jgi:hypothetical protein